MTKCAAQPTNETCGFCSVSQICRVTLVVAAFVLLPISLWQDTELLQWYRSFDLPVWTTTVEDWASANVYTILLLSGIVLMALSDASTRRLAIISMPTQTVLVQILKHSFGRVRPCHSGDDLLFAGPSAFHTSFPSGHATVVWTIVFVLWHRYPKLWFIWIWIGAVLSWARVHAEAHFVSDVIAGVVIGFCVVTIATWMSGRLPDQWVIHGMSVQPSQKIASECGKRCVRKLVWGSIGLSYICVLGTMMLLQSHQIEELNKAEATRIVTELYWSVLQREPDPVGLASYEAMLQEGAIVYQIHRSIALSPEHIRGLLSLERGEMVRRIYVSVLLRPPTEDEYENAITTFEQLEENPHTVRLIVRRVLLLNAISDP